MFVTYETFSPDDVVIELINAKTMTNEGPVSAPGASNLAGLSYDADRNLLYVVDRNSNHLFVYLWDASAKTLTLQGGTYKELDYGGAMGLAFDDTTDFLYVTNASNIVHYYDASDGNWSHIGSIDVGRIAYDVDVDPCSNVLYTGGYAAHTYLVKTDLTAPNNSEELNIGAGLIGLAVDRDSGLLYATTYHNQLRVYNCQDSPFTLTDSEGIAAGAGVCVPGRGSNVSFVPPLGVIKTDDVEDCIDPVDGEEITYTINVYDAWFDPCDPCNSDWDELESLTIRDSLSEMVDFVSMDPCDNAVYDPCSHTVTWTIDPNTCELPFSVSLVVSINEYVAPGGSIKNTVRIEMEVDGKEYWDEDTIYTDVCGCGEYGDIIYVDKDATAGAQNGSSWYDAFLNLDAGLEIATVCDKIYVAEGRYKPANVNDPNQLYSFEMVNGVAVYGGFAGLGADDPDERNWMIYETILCGDITDNDNYNFPVNDDPNRLNTENSYYVVRSEDKVNCAILDGFIIRNGWEGGILCESGALTASHNRIKENIQGIYGYDARMFIENNWIYRNIDGIYMEDPNAVITVGHCTVANNHQAGIYFDGWIDPVINNCISWGNEDEDNLVGCSATYSCIEDGDIGTGNIDDDPCFVDSENDDYHLDWDSPCIDAGDPGMYYGGKRDIDKHWRKIGLWTDMGADEYKDCSYISPADFNEDEIVNLLDFCDFSAHWLYASNDQGWDDLYDLDEDGTIIDIADFALFAEDWLWMSCARMVSLPMDLGKSMSMGMPDGQKSAGRSVSTDKKVASPPPELTIKELIEQLKDIIVFLDEIWQTHREELIKEISEKEWFELMDMLNKELDKLIEQLD
ncbi:MAG: right-handed parallel beta-helix repeat-containing protein [Sedimentisphaerales bacterium]|nr:right-handed parallel beta-helix repeat-containing protein [Sedimentisphaerales bacterium]